MPAKKKQDGQCTHIFYILELSRNQCRTGNVAVCPLYTAEPYLTVNSIKVSIVAFMASRRQQYNLLSSSRRAPEIFVRF